MDLAKNNGRMDHITKDILKPDASMVKEHINGLMEVHTKESGSIITLRVMVNIYGQMVALMKVPGKKINYMEKDSILGVMVGLMMGFMWRIKSKVMELIFGQTVGNMKVIGTMASNMVKANL